MDPGGRMSLWRRTYLPPFVADGVAFLRTTSSMPWRSRKQNTLFFHRWRWNGVLVLSPRHHNQWLTALQRPNLIASSHALRCSKFGELQYLNNLYMDRVVFTKRVEKSTAISNFSIPCPCLYITVLGILFPFL
jgi:hypothetical protein